MEWEGLIIGISIVLFVVGILLSASYLNETTPNLLTCFLCIFGPIFTGLGIVYELKD